MQMRQHLYSTQQISQRLSDVDERQLVFELSMMRRESGASEITIYGSNNRILATSSDSSSAGTAAPAWPTKCCCRCSRTGLMLSLDPQDYEIRTAVLFHESRPGGTDGRHAGDTFPSDGSAFAYGRQCRYVLSRIPATRIPAWTAQENTFSLTLTVVLMLSLLAAIYGAFVSVPASCGADSGSGRGYARGCRGRFRHTIADADSRRNRFPDQFLQRHDAASGVRAARGEPVTGARGSGTDQPRGHSRAICRPAYSHSSPTCGFALPTRRPAPFWVSTWRTERGETLTDVAKGKPLLEQFVDVAQVHLRRR